MSDTRKMVKNDSYFRAVQEALEKKDYPTAERKWDILKIKAMKLEDKGREFPDSVIDLGLKMCEEALEDYSERLEKNFEEILEKYKIMRKISSYLDKYVDLLMFSICKKSESMSMNELVNKLEDKLSEAQERLSVVRNKLFEKGKYIKHPNKWVM